MYFDKELAEKNRIVDNESWELLYGHYVSIEFRKKYSADKCEAVVNNYLDDPTNNKYILEFREMQEYRKYCKNLVKKMMEF